MKVADHRRQVLKLTDETVQKESDDDRPGDNGLISTKEEGLSMLCSQSPMLSKVPCRTFSWNTSIHTQVEGAQYGDRSTPSRH